ncbi:beta-1,3-glucanase family protein [uncultured Polaribacter sp.]|uniref:beta-1,3-glucanase family protein n=1 Tax=uncultured Polaribacter sp. TaxID=174711 RepID=UPI00262913FC|nr:beta-1,3-glucanase family protein [uncultured Polaribacter sp.]
MKIKIVNNRGTDQDLHLLLTGDKQKGVKGITANKSVKLSDLISTNPKLEIDIESIEGARLYVGCGAFPSDDAPLPDGDQYYGWIEFTKKATGAEVWLNLSNVDITGLPLILAGTDTANKAFTLGYKKSIIDIISLMKTAALKPATDKNPAYITCKTGQTKIVGPNGSPDSYPSYKTYISNLNTNKTPLTITSDTPKNGKAKVFKGSFMNAVNDTDVMISLKSEEGDTFEVLKSQFTTEICYRCDGGTLIYNGKTVDQNQSPQNTNDKMYANSTFRDILIGINEGYFTIKGPNKSIDFPGQVPFSTGQGSDYAKILHENSNSYGFPYADSNLKVLITAIPSDTITMTICKDDEAKGYNDDTTNSPNQPTSGEFQFGIGANSQSLGMITIGGWRYPADSLGAYGGFLPTLTEWTKMNFEGPNKYIWIKTTGNGFISADNCFNTGAPTYSDKKVLTWGADVKWVSGTDSPSKPTT